LLAAAWFAWDTEAILAWKESASPPLFFSAMALLPAVGLPLTPFYIIAGATFGVWVGLIGSLIALTVNLSICYVVAKSIPRAWLQNVLERFGTELPRFEQTSNAVRFSVLVKFTPGVPMLLKNYLLGLSGVPFKVYLFTSLVTSALYAVPLMVLGNSLFDHDWNKSRVALVLALAAGAGVWLWRRRAKRQ
jgi:uncharacterized membrane protein YdjX (TVP38/TMEM64 family)